MLTQQSTKPPVIRQPNPFTPDLDRRRYAHFETSISQIWGIEEQTFEPDPECRNMVSARLTVILQFKDRHMRKTPQMVKAIIREELKKLADSYGGQWSTGQIPFILNCEDVKVEGFEAIALTRTQWTVVIDLSGTDTYEPPDNWRY